MRVQLQLTILLATMTVVFLGLFFLLFGWWENRLNDWLAASEWEQGNTLVQIDRLHSAEMRATTQMVAQAVSLGVPLAAVRAPAAGGTRAAALHFALFSRHGDLKERNPAATARTDPWAGLVGRSFEGFVSHRESYFRWLEGQLWEYVQYPVTRKADSWDGYLVSAREWDTWRGQNLEELTRARLQIVPVDGVSDGSPMEITTSRTGRTVKTRIPKTGYDGRPTAFLEFETLSPLAGALVVLTRRQILFLCILIAATGMVVFWLVQRWVIQPLMVLNRAMSTRTAEGIPHRLRAPTEILQLARLVREFFAQQQELERKEAALQAALRERARLARDLHDGLIQQVYAVGLKLERLRLRSRVAAEPDPKPVEEIRGDLNNVIRKLRGFIHSLGEGAARTVDLGPEMRQFFRDFPWPKGCRYTLQIDEEAASSLREKDGRHLLFIASELVSNACRHGKPSLVDCQLRKAADSVVFSLRDNGGGFDPVLARQGSGPGLRNLRARAMELDASYEIDSEPGADTLITLEIPK